MSTSRLVRTRAIVALSLSLAVPALASACDDGATSSSADSSATDDDAATADDTALATDATATSDDVPTSDDATTTTADTVDVDVPVVSAPMIHEAGLCTIPPSPRLSVTAGTDMWRVTLDAPDAVCNDGSPGIFYVSPAPAGSPDADKWIVWLEGGSGCVDARSCADRWCGVNPTYTAGKMSSRFAPAGVVGGGIFDRDPGGGAGVNDFAGYNMVMAYYCTSDNWTGRAERVATDPSGTYPEYALHIKGAFVLEAMIQALQSDAGAESDGGEARMPDIDDATQVLFMGTSAGGGGVRNTADWVREMLLADNLGLDFRAVVDAGVHPKVARPPAVTDEDIDAILQGFADVSIGFRDAVTDESCLAFHAADDPRLCWDNTHVLLHHVATPWYLKIDLTDASNSPGIYPDGQTYTAVVTEMMNALAAPGSEAEEADARLFEPGLFAPNCGHHVNLEVADFYRIQVARDGNAAGNHDVLSNWVRGTGTMQAIHDPANGVTSVCP